MAVEVVGALVATYAVKGLGGVHALVGAVLGATVVSQVAQAVITVPVESRLGHLSGSLLDGDDDETQGTAASVATSTTAAAVTSTVASDASTAATAPSVPDELAPGPELPPSAAPAAAPTAGRSARRRVLSTSLAAVSALVATLVVVFGVTAIEVGSGRSVIASGDRATTFFSPRDTSPPRTLDDPWATDTRLELRYAEQLRAREIEGADGFSLGTTGPPQIERVSISGDLVVLELSTEVTDESRLSLSYHGQTVVDEAGNRAATFRGLPVRVVPRPPRPLEPHGVDGSRELELPFDEPLASADESELLASVTVTINDEKLTPTAAAIADDDLRLTLPDPLALDALVVVTYTAGDTRPLRDLAGNPVVSFEKSERVAPDTTPPTVTEVEPDAQGVKVVFSEPLDAGNTLDLADFTVTVDGTDATVTTVAVSGDTVVLELAAPLPAGVDGEVRYAGDSLRDGAGNAVTAGVLGDFTTSQAEQPPVFQRAEFAPAEHVVVLVYDVALDTSSVPVASSFAITLGSERYAPSDVSFDASAPVIRLSLDEMLALRLEQALVGGKEASVEYTPGDDPIRSTEGAVASALEPQPITVAG